MATKQYLGQLSAFQQESDTISAYLERVQIFFNANGIEDDKQKVPIFLNAVGARTYALLRDLLSPEKPAAKNFAELQKALTDHFEPKPLVIAERFYFHQRTQGTNESVLEYVAELRRLATHCEFGAFLQDAYKNAKKLKADDASTPIHRTGHYRFVKPPRQPSGNTKTCYRCGDADHIATTCRFREAECKKCHKKGHLARVCKSGSRPPQQNSHTKEHSKSQNHQKKALTIREPDSDDSGDVSPLNRIGGKLQPIMVELTLNGEKTAMELDTGAAVSVISSTAKDKLFPQLKPESTSVILATYTGEKISVLGQIMVDVKYGKQHKKLPLYVVKGDGPSLLGRNWLTEINLNWKSLKLMSITGTQATPKPQMSYEKQMEALLQEHKAVFQEGLGQISKFEATLQLKPTATPKFCKARSVPFALQTAVERELDRLEGEGILERVSYSQWAAPIVSVPKPEGTIRICGDYKVTINPQLEVDQYPLPKPDTIFSTLSEGKWFSKIDLTHAYQQLKLSPTSRELVTINTHRGLYQYTRLPFGVASAPAIFQKVMDTVLQGLPKVICYLDDILISASTPEEHLDNVKQVLQRLEQYGIRARKSKCAFMCTAVEYLGHRVDSTGLHTLESKVTAVVDAPHPRDIQELRSFLGLVHYYGKFLQNLSTLLHPLNQLLKQGSKWHWSKECDKAFTKAKHCLVTAPVLAHYNPNLPIRLAADASAYGIGAVISHVFPDGTERPVAFASRTLTATERNYAQIQKEALSLIYAVQKFHQYLYGRSFVLVTDHKPLTTILGHKAGIPSLAAARLQRWALILSAYTYTIEFRPTKQHANADGLSRLPLGTRREAALDYINSFMVGQIQAMPVTAEQVQVTTRCDPVLSQVFRYVQDGWPATVNDKYKPFYKRKDELSIEAGCLLWGNRVIVPEKFRSTLIEELHQDHPGASRMKSVARSYFWYPGLDKDLEDRAQGCVACQGVKNSPPVAPLHPWVWPATPWQRIHVDFAGPFMNKSYLLVTDAHSKWPEIIEMNSTTTQKTITELRKLFSAYGLPLQLVSDNGPQFISEDFAQFTKLNGIKHIRCAPYHPASNGAVERLVQTFKKAMKTAKECGKDLQKALSSFLLTYRTTPHTTTHETPAKLFLNRQLRTRLDLLLPNKDKTVLGAQAKQKQNHDHTRNVMREFKVGEAVMARSNVAGTPDVKAVIKQRLGPLMYEIETDTGLIWKRHVDHLKSLGTVVKDSQPETEEDIIIPTSLEERPAATAQSNEQQPAEPAEPVRRYPQRQRRCPERYTPQTGN